MPAIFSKNCVVLGVLDSYCLVCSQHLRAQAEALTHIQTAPHKRNLDSTAYFDKYANDYNKKVKGIYFCEVCNMTFTTATKVGLHVTEEAHLENKRYKCIKRVDNSIIFQDNTAITEDAWHGLVDDTCVICNEDIDGDSTHKTNKKHVLNLIQSRIIVDGNNSVYRKINDICQCLTCNKVVSGNIIMEHLNSEEHKSAFLILNQDLKEISKMKSVDDNDGEGSSANNDDNNDVITLEDDQPNNVDGKTLFTKPVQMKDNNQQPNCTKSVPEEVKAFAKQNGLSVKDGGRVFCDVCRTQVPATLDTMKQHVAESKHKDNLTVHKQINKKITQRNNKLPIEEFITELQMYEIGQDFYMVINNKFCVKGACFLGVGRCENRLVCHFCPENLPFNMMSFIMHIDTPRHVAVMKRVSVITSLENEFVREVKPNLYDCCFCGVIERDWDIMRAHLNSVEHKWKREQYDHLLQRFREHELEERIRQAMPYNWINMMNRMRQFQF